MQKLKITKVKEKTVTQEEIKQPGSDQKSPAKSESDQKSPVKSESEEEVIETTKGRPKRG